MEIVVYGTFSGHKILYPSQPGQIVKRGLFDDKRLQNPQSKAIGQEVYSLQFSTIREKDSVISNYILSKYRIVRDKPGDKRTGYIAVSIIIPHNRKMPGSDMQSMLDIISNEVYNRNINDDNLVSANIDRMFLKDRMDEYRRRYSIIPDEDVECYRTGQKEAAYIYYDGRELHNYFDAPYQEAYRDYKQIFFVKSHFENRNSNPLNALQHDSASNLTGKVDLYNPTYTLYLCTKNKLNIHVLRKGREVRDGERIKRKHVIEIRYSRPFHLPPPPLKGAVGDLCAANPEHIEIAGNTCRINYRELEKERKTVKFRFSDNHFKLLPVDNPYVMVEDKLRYRMKNHELTFSGDDIGKTWNLIFGKYETRERISIIPDQVRSEIPVEFKSSKKISVVAKDAATKDIIYSNVNITIDGIHHIYRNEIEFFGAEIENEHLLEVFHKDYKPYCQTFKLSRYAMEEEVYLERKITPAKRYYWIHTGENGKEKDRKLRSFQDDGSDCHIIANKGFKFTGFVLDAHKKDCPLPTETDPSDLQFCNGTLIAHYEKLDNLLFRLLKN